MFNFFKDKISPQEITDDKPRIQEIKKNNSSMPYLEDYCNSFLKEDRKRGYGDEAINYSKIVFEQIEDDGFNVKEAFSLACDKEALDLKKEKVSNLKDVYSLSTLNEKNDLINNRFSQVDKNAENILRSIKKFYKVNDLDDLDMDNLSFEQKRIVNSLKKIETVKNKESLDKTDNEIIEKRKENIDNKKLENLNEEISFIRGVYKDVLNRLDELEEYFFKNDYKDKSEVIAVGVKYLEEWAAFKKELSSKKSEAELCLSLIKNKFSSYDDLYKGLEDKNSLDNFIFKQKIVNFLDRVVAKQDGLMPRYRLSDSDLSKIKTVKSELFNITYENLSDKQKEEVNKHNDNEYKQAA